MQKTQKLIKLANQQLLRDQPSNGDDSVEVSLSLDELQDTADKLEKKLQSNLMKLMGKDAATAAAIKKAMKDKFLSLRLKSRALLIRIRQKVLQSLLAAVPYKRRISRAKKGKWYISNMLWEQ